MIVKMYCIFAMESVKKMNGNRGKLASMAGHAYLHSFWDSDRRFPSYYGGIGGDSIGPADAYKNSGLAFKITCIVDTVDQLKTLEESYKSVCGVSLVTDAGRTVFPEPTTVCLGIGPIYQSGVMEDLSGLELFL